MSLDLESALDFTARKNLHGRAHAGQAAGVDVVKRDVVFAFKGFQQAVKIDHAVGNLKRGILEAVLGQTALQGHLAAFEARGHTATGTGILAFVAFARRATQTGTRATAHATAGLALFRKRKEIVQLHGICPPTVIR
ncbi:hypothetical protein KL86DES1_10976 [uncultured Desulfovibrio sp.]|uniref:Uncharacterized protein n=1 Tax=uncultured Desulfovibrio sp. TaxID=167968 RepID=A0A212L1A5_9BACT|nr:hypothetical protein KL86DES1_10976 [uncultured Desulfovibrio sp.]VZH32848.1 conserved protein of unknown function [Desulfovibrio sp. 86]